MFVTSSLCLNLFLAASLKLVMNFLNVVQWIAHLSVMRIAFPGNFQFLVETIVNIGNVNLLSTY